MIVKKYTAPTEKQAIIQAKEDLGAGAVVLNVKTIKQRGISRLFKKDYVEITAALEEKELANNVSERKNPSSLNMAANLDTEGYNAFRNQNEKIIEEKLDNLHSLLKDQMNKKTEEETEENISKYKPAKPQEEKVQESESSNFKYLKLIYGKLLDSEIDEKLANIIVEDIESSLKKESNIDSIISAVYQKIILKLGEASLINEEEGKQKVVFFMGPTGVGKTTTIAKLASEFILNKKKKIALITADTYRIAAVEQLNTYGGILDAPVFVIYTPTEIVEGIKHFADYDMIFVDTAGRSHKNAQLIEELEEMFVNIEKSDLDVDIEKYLVLSATTKYHDLLKITDAYKKIKDYKLLFTKLDETDAFGNILNIRHITGASLSYTTCGQNVPNDIEPMDVQGLAKHLISGATK